MWRRGVLLCFYSLPDFWAALMIMVIFSVLVAGSFPPEESSTRDARVSSAHGPRFKDRVSHLVLPVGSLVLLSVAASPISARRDAGGSAGRLHSHRARERLDRARSDLASCHAHGAAPMITLLGTHPARVVSAARLFVEKVFAWPGMGMLAARRDRQRATTTS